MMGFCRLFPLVGLILQGRLAAQAVHSSQPARADQVRIAEARRLARELADQVWPGLAGTPMPVLLVTDSTEFLIRRSPDRPEWSRARTLSPALVATFPVDGAPTIVVGTPERTGKTSTEWALTLLHEHFHQWQYSQANYYAGVARLGLARGDTTGMWMLEYPFPYDSAPVARAFKRLALALRDALRPDSHGQEIREVLSARDALGDRLSPDDYRYLEFQLWQEGVARYVEYRATQLAAGQGVPSGEFRALADYQPYRSMAERTRRDLGAELERANLRRDRRVSFYPLGAAVALLLDRVRPEWKTIYASQPFALAVLLTDVKGE